MNDRYTYEGKTIEEATAKGLRELGVNAEDVAVEIKSRGGLFSKAQVIITVKGKEEVAPVEEVALVEEEDTEEVSTPKAPNEELLIAAENRARDFINELVLQMGLDCEGTVTRDGEEINVKFNGKGASAVIGYRGEVLDAIQYMTLWIANRECKDFVRVSIDAENYRDKRKETLTRLAVSLAHKCHKSGRKVELEPMNPFERRVIHTALQDDKFVRTESHGEGRFRHVVILPKEEARKERREYNSSPRPQSNGGITTPQMSYGTSSNFRKKGYSKTKSFGASPKKF